MKKIIIIAICLITTIFTGCTKIEKEENEEKINVSMFIILEEHDLWMVVYHKETKIMYAVSNGYHNKGTFTILVDENGKPLIWK